MCVVQAVGGWEELGKLEGDDWKWFKQKRFSELYKIYAKTPHLAPSYLAGTSEKENSFLGRGHKHDKIYFIGEDKNAVSVLEFKQILAREKLQSPVAAMLSGINKAAV